MFMRKQNSLINYLLKLFNIKLIELQHRASLPGISFQVNFCNRHLNEDIIRFQHHPRPPADTTKTY